MQSFLILLLSIAGLSWILVKSPLFKPFREHISRKRILYEIAKKSTELRSFKNNIKLRFYWFIDTLLNCEGCIGFWCALICYTFDKYHLDFILFAFAGSAISLSIIGFINFLNRK